MEIAVPLIALGGMYIISNQTTKQENKKREIRSENYANMGIRTNLATKESELHGNYFQTQMYLRKTIQLQTKNN